MDKQKLREIMIQKRLVLDAYTYASDSNLIMSLVEKSKAFKEAKVIGIYVSMKQEVETLSFIKKWYQQKQICVPKIQQGKMQFYKLDSLTCLQKGSFGILEPQSGEIIEKKDIDMLLIPIVAFDQNYQRIGYGGGYYDRYLQGYHGIKLGIAFSFQKIDTIVPEAHDIALDYVIHEKSSTIL